MKVAFGCHLIAISLGALFGIVYLCRSEFMPYHARAVGREWVSLEPRMQALLVGFLKATGGGLLGGSVAGGFILLSAFRRAARWAVWAVPSAGLLTSLSTLWASLYVQHHTSATTPWIASAIGCALFISGLVLSRPWRSNSPDSPDGTSGGGTGASGDSVICTELRRQGYLDDRTWEADQAFGSTVPVHVRAGYYRWGVPLAHAMSRSKWLTRTVWFLVGPWLQHMAYVQHATDKDSLTGRCIMVLGWKVCAWLGRKAVLA